MNIESRLIWLLVAYLFGIFVGYLAFDYFPAKKQTVPEEYKLIDKTDVLRGYFDRDSTLVIEFENVVVNPEYTLEIINIDSVAINTGTEVYKCRMDEIEEVLLRDNL